MIGQVNANALTASGLAAFAADSLQVAGFFGGDDEIRIAAAEAVAPLVQATIAALELAGVTAQESGAGVRDVLADYLGTRLALQPGTCRICGCSQLNACVDTVPIAGGYRNCAWADSSRTLCDTPDCLRKAEAAAAQLTTA